MAELKAGDTVQLKSGGPVMTIDQIATKSGRPDPHAWCQWFEKTKLSTGVFPVSSLVSDE